ncbi:unnamed protein product [Spirodela intermedia]|uniref:Uncharacterized protein n=1 Tax=Spirodela intermedia TaxID=51605 RepID=A0A7I8LDG6_SPIIN|nr:unnamed protein product [Spirodela intermedia]
MASTAEPWAQGLYVGCLSSAGVEVRRRPYHRNCGCALHKSGGCTGCLPSSSKVEYPICRSWRSSCLTTAPPPPPPVFFSDSPDRCSLRDVVAVGGIRMDSNEVGDSW